MFKNKIERILSKLDYVLLLLTKKQNKNAKHSSELNSSDFSQDRESVNDSEPSQ